MMTPISQECARRAFLSAATTQKKSLTAPLVPLVDS